MLIKPETNLKRMSDRTLAAYLYDAFERHSYPACGHMDELSHTREMKRSIAPALQTHNANKMVSQEMWVIAILAHQFKRFADPAIEIPNALKPFGNRINNHPAFQNSFSDVREYLRTIPELKRA